MKARAIRVSMSVGRWSGLLTLLVLLVAMPGGCPLDPGNDPGQDGTDGNVGPEGPQGPAGPEGPQGPQGLQGAQGIQGPTGPQGTTGATGEQGLAGYSCWDLNSNGKGDLSEDKNLDGNYNALDCQNLPGNPGLSCWDINGNGVGDPDEDVNLDGNFDAEDCRGSAGPAGPQGAAGRPCWDLDGDGVNDPSEDANLDGQFNALDCRGAAGAAGLACWDLNANGVGDPDEDVNLDGQFTSQDCQGTSVAGPPGPQGPPGPAGPQGAMGPPGPTGISCWDLDADGVADPEEDINDDGVVDVYDCQNGAAAGNFWALGGNNVGAAEALGTLGDAALEFIVNGLRALRLEPGGTSPNLVGGHASNAATAGVSGVTIGGGGSEGAANAVESDFGTIGGGFNNTILGLAATIPGGQDNRAEGAYSLAAGHGAEALHPGSFVWADSSAPAFASTRNDEFRVKAAGGVDLRIGGSYVILRQSGNKLIDTSTNAFLSLGGVWTNSSDLALKDNVLPVDGPDILSKLDQLPIQTWNYLAEGAETRHIGPMAQDFYNLFGVGYGDTVIATCDADGVALAAIKALNQRCQTQQAKIADLEQRLADLVKRTEALERSAAGKK